MQKYSKSANGSLNHLKNVNLSLIKAIKVKYHLNIVYLPNAKNKNEG